MANITEFCLGTLLVANCNLVVLYLSELNYIIMEQFARKVVSAGTVNSFKARLDRFWANE